MKPSLLCIEERDLVHDWTIKYVEHLSFILDVTSNSLQPSVDDYFTYIMNRSYLKKNEASILPLWGIFQTWSQMYYSRQDGVAIDTNLDYSMDNPFGYFYEAEDLYHFAVAVELQENLDSWQPDSSRVYYMAMILSLAVLLANRFFQWACEDKICMKSHWRKEISVGNYIVLASSDVGLTFREDRIDEDPLPDKGIYLSETWNYVETSYPKVVLDWTPGGVIDLDLLYETVQVIIDLIKDGELIEIGCDSGHGRTGTLLACLLVELEKLEPDIAIEAIRARYCDLAVETPEQEHLISEYTRYRREVVKSINN